MGTSRKTTESQLEQAKASLERHVKILREKGVDAKKFKNDPKWRTLDAAVRQINSRLRKIGEVESVNAELLKLKEENAAKRAAEIADRKSGASRKPKAEAAEAKKPKGEPKAAKKESGKKEPKAEKPAKDKKDSAKK